MATKSAGVVLHVDDELIVRKAMALLLSSQGYSVISAVNGPEALRLVDDGIRPDLLIVDFNLADAMNGAEAAEELRRALGYAPPVIILTGDPASAEFPWITDAPIWLARKPLSPELFLAALPGLIQLSRATRELCASGRRSHSPVGERSRS
jgi:CheY-like chemotaxis protein